MIALGGHAAVIHHILEPGPLNTLALGPSWLDPDYLIGEFGLIGVLVIVFAESGLLIGFFLPGDSLLFTTGLLVTTGKLDTPLWLVCLLVALAAVIGDQAGYLFGRKVGPSLFNRPDSRLFKQENVEKAHEFFEKYGPKSLILARFVPVGVEFAREPAQRGGVDEFVGEEDALDPVGPVDAGLVRDGRGDAPRAVLQLAGEELWGHRRLAVRGEREAVAPRVRLQEGEVVLDGLGRQREHRGGEPAGEEVAPLGGQLGDGQPLRVGRERLEPVVDPFISESGQSGQFARSGHGTVGSLGSHGGLLDRSGSSWVVVGHRQPSSVICTVLRCSTCNTHCVYRSGLSNIRADARSKVRTGAARRPRGAPSARNPGQDRRRRRDHRCRVPR